MQLYLLDYGELIKPGEDEFDAYNMVYDRLWGYRDAGQAYYASVEEALADVPEELRTTPNFYVVVTDQGDVDVDEVPEYADDGDELPGYVEHADYTVDSVVRAELMVDGQAVQMRGFAGRRAQKGGGSVEPPPWLSRRQSLSSPAATFMSTRARPSLMASRSTVRRRSMAPAKIFGKCLRSRMIVRTSRPARALASVSATSRRVTPAWLGFS